MDKSEILEKSIRENKDGDERDKDIEGRAAGNAYQSIMVVFVLLAVISCVQEFLTGSAFADYKAFALAVFVGSTGYFWTKYAFYKEKKFVTYTILFAIVSIVTLIGLIVGA